MQYSVNKRNNTQAFNIKFDLLLLGCARVSLKATNNKVQPSSRLWYYVYGG